MQDPQVAAVDDNDENKENESSIADDNNENTVEDRSRKRSVDQLSRAKSEDDLSTAGDGTQFTRDGLGRQSISEKRHGTIDAKTTKQYWEIKAKRGESPTKPTTTSAASGRDAMMAARPKTTHFEGVDVMKLIKAAEEKGIVMGVGGAPVEGSGSGEREIKAREDGDERRGVTAVKVEPLRKSASLESLQKVIQKRESEASKGE